MSERTKQQIERLLAMNWAEGVAVGKQLQKDQIKELEAENRQLVDQAGREMMEGEVMQVALNERVGLQNRIAELKTQIEVVEEAIKEGCVKPSDSEFSRGFNACGKYLLEIMEQK